MIEHDHAYNKIDELWDGVRYVGAREYASTLEWTVMEGEKCSCHLD